MKQFKEYLPVYLNGFCTGFLAFGREYGATEIILLVICAITFTWYSHNIKQK
jgi:hypothetical protein